ncbi:MAG TPA: hypothetical protein VFW52_00840, partial [Candidatus Saccharimonadales bacterium]|nr:hypothetical protein [Candidatus Saccharimonadales bacterium]
MFDFGYAYATIYVSSKDINQKMLIKSNWRNILPAAVAALAAPLVVAVQAAAANTATVAATVTPQNISVSVTDGVVAYGTLDVSS